MPDKDTSNLPILDDIIIPGDAEKAVPTPSSKVQSTLLADDGTATTAPHGAIAPTRELEPSNDAEAGIIVDPIAEPYDHDAGTNAPAPPAPTPLEELIQTIDEELNSSSSHPDIQPETVTAPNIDIDVLTVEILSSLMPAVEQLMIKKIRQTLRQHLTTETEE